MAGNAANSLRLGEFKVDGTKPTITPVRRLPPIQAQGTASDQEGNAVTVMQMVNIDGTVPSCAVTAVGTDPQGQKYLQATVRDTVSGLQAITVTGAHEHAGQCSTPRRNAHQLRSVRIKDAAG